MPTFEYVAEVRVIVEAETEDSAHNTVMEMLDNIAYEVHSVQLAS